MEPFFKSCFPRFIECKIKAQKSQKKYQRFAKRIKRFVVAYQGFVSPWGDTPPRAKEADENTGRIFRVWFPEPYPVIFSPY